jgi:outer membrane protein TolC
MRRSLESKITVSVILTAAFAAAPVAIAETIKINPKWVEARVVEQFPSLKNRLLEIDVARGQNLAASGALDFRLKGGTEDKEGYYDTLTDELTLGKQFAFQGIEVKGGWRKGRGNFPSYSGAETSADGEAFYKIEVPILRGRSIDSVRQNLRVTEAGVDRAGAGFRIQSLMVRSAALHAYWDVVRFEKIKIVLENLLSTVKQRQDWIERKAKAGAVARLLVKENLKSLLQVEENLVTANNKLNQGKNDLAFYLFGERESGKTIAVEIPKNDDPFFEDRLHLDTSKRWLSTHPAFVDLGLEKEQEAARLEFARNNMLPKINVMAEQRQPRGPGTTNLTEDEKKIGFTLDMPLNLSEARGQKRVAKRKIEVIDNKRDQLERDLSRENANVLQDLARNREKWDLVRKQAQVDTELRSAEESIFRQGSSNMINLNIRERTLLESQVKVIETDILIRKLLVDLGAVRGQDRFVD